MEKVKKTLVILNPTGISGKEINDRVSIYKFESDAIVKFNLNEIKKTTITVFDLTGRIVKTKTCMASTETEIIELGEASGIYIVQVQFGNEAIVKKLVK